MMSYQGKVITPDSKVHGASMGPVWGRQDPGGLHVDPWTLLSGTESLWEEPAGHRKGPVMQGFDVFHKSAGLTASLESVWVELRFGVHVNFLHYIKTP